MAKDDEVGVLNLPCRAYHTIYYSKPTDKIHGSMINLNGDRGEVSMGHRSKKKNARESLTTSGLSTIFHAETRNMLCTSTLPQRTPIGQPICIFESHLPMERVFSLPGFWFLSVYFSEYCGIDHVSYYTFPRKRGGYFWKTGNKTGKEQANCTYQDPWSQ